MLVHDYRQCEAIIRQASKTFYAAFSRLPWENRNGIFAMYAFCRLADDAVDCQSAHPAHNLAGFEEEFHRFSQGETPDRYHWRALRDTVERFEITDLTPFQRMLRGQHQDLVKHRYESMDQLFTYCDDVATSVGDMIWSLISPHPYLKLTPLKQALGRAMQITNILRDIGEDLERGRIYIPANLFQHYGYSQEQLHRHEVNSRFIDLWESMASVADGYYHDAEPLYKYLYPQAKFPLVAASVLYQEILNEIRRARYHVFRRRIYVPQLTKLRVLACSRLLM